MGRSKFTEATRKAILEGIEAGLPLNQAAGRAGVGRRTVYDWLAKGAENPDGSYADFALAVEEANANAAFDAVEELRKAGRDDWRASLAYLERRFPEEWSRRERHEVTGADGAPIKIELQWPTAAGASAPEGK